MEMEVTPEQRVQIRLLSDGALCQDAEGFVARTAPVENSQMSGLLEYSHSWEELRRFVEHQTERDWGEPGKSSRAHYQEFYNNLLTYLHRLRDDVRDKYGFVPDGLTKTQTRECTDFFAGLLAREFVQHLSAEMMWQAWQKEG